MRLQGRVGLVTGAGNGIGRAVAIMMAREGAAVVAADNSDQIHDTATKIEAEGGRCVPVQSDVGTEEGCALAVETAEDSFGGLQAVVHSAAVSQGGTVATIQKEDWQRVMDVDLSSAFYLGRASIPVMERSGGGAIVLVASQLGLAGARGSVAYTAAKGGLVNLTRSMALDHAEQEIRVNCLCPGPVDTAFLERSFERQPDASAARDELLAKVPLGRFGHAEEIAHGAIFLVSPETEFMTGTTLVMDGGYLAQ